MLDFSSLLEAHIAAQSGSYVSGVDALPGGGRFLWSARLAEPSLNLAVETEAVEEIRAAAARRGRLPAVLAPDAASLNRLAARPGFAGAFPTAWMVRAATANDAAPALDGLSAEVTAGPRPSPAFFTAARGLYDDPQVSAAAEDYVAVLAHAETGAGVDALHLVLSEGPERPVAAASVYRVGTLAGLYNVGTVTTHRKRGLGRLVTRAALALAAEAGAQALFLQCAAHGEVERLYGDLGFTPAARPSLVCFEPAA